MGDPYARFYNKSYIEVWRLFSNSYPLLLFTAAATVAATAVAATAVAATAVAATSPGSSIPQQTVGGGGKNNNIKYNYYSESSDYSSDDDTIASNEFYNKLLLNYKNMKGGMEDGDSMAEDTKEKVSKKRNKEEEESEVPKGKKQKNKEIELKTQICLQKKNYEEVYKLNKKFWMYLKDSSPAEDCSLNELFQFIFTQINTNKHLEKFLMAIPNLASTLSQIAKLSEQSYSLKKQAEISNLMLKRAATGIQIDTNAFKIKYGEDLRLNQYQTEFKELVLGNTVKESFFDVVEDIYDVDEHIPKKVIRSKCDELNGNKSRFIDSLKTDYSFSDDLEGNDLLKQCLNILRLKCDRGMLDVSDSASAMPLDVSASATSGDSSAIPVDASATSGDSSAMPLDVSASATSGDSSAIPVDASATSGDSSAMPLDVSDYKFLFDIWNELVENLKEFLVSISNKGRIFFVEDSVSKKMLVLIQILFPFIYKKDTDILSIILPKRYEIDGTALQSLSYNSDEEIREAKRTLFNGKLPFDDVAKDEEEIGAIQDFFENTELHKYVDIHHYILSFCYCNLIYRLCPILLLEQAILKQFTIFDEEEMNKVDKSRTIDVLELIRNTLKTWDETDNGDDMQKKELLDNLEQNPSLAPFGLFELFHKKYIDDIGEYKYPKGDLSSKKEHITLMQQYCNKYSLSLKKAFDLIEFLRNGNKKLDELQSKLKSDRILQLYFNKNDLKKISDSIEKDKEILSKLLEKQEKVILDFISNILPGAGSEGRQDDKKNLDEIEFAKEIKNFKTSNSDMQTEINNIAELKKNLDDLQKALEKTEEELETLKKTKAKLKKGKDSDTTIIENDIEKLKNRLKVVNEQLKEKKDEYDKANSEYEYNVLLLFLEKEKEIASKKHINFLRRMFGFSESTHDDISKIITELTKHKDKYKNIYQEFKVGLGLDHAILESSDLKDKEIIKHLTRILHNAIDFKHILFSEKQKIKSDDADSGNSDSLKDHDLKSEQILTVQNLIKLLSNQLLTFKGLRTANEYKDKLNNINKKRSNETEIEYQERVKKVNEAKYPILKHVVLFDSKTNKYEINQGLVDYLSVKEEELKTLLRILQLYNNCKMLESKLKKAGEEGEEGEEGEGGEEEDEEDEEEGE